MEPSLSVTVLRREVDKDEVEYTLHPCDGPCPVLVFLLLLDSITSDINMAERDIANSEIATMIGAMPGGVAILL